MAAMALLRPCRVRRRDPHDMVQRRAALEIREDRSGMLSVPSLLSVKVQSFVAVMQLLAKGNSNRAVRHTEMNVSSSRSHAILQLVVEQWPGQAAGGDGTSSSGTVMRSKLNFIDLAGSERWNKDVQMGSERVSELTSINGSLSALATVVSALTEGVARKHVPYRNSKLTSLLQVRARVRGSGVRGDPRLHALIWLPHFQPARRRCSATGPETFAPAASLTGSANPSPPPRAQDSLGGNCNTTIIATVSPCADAFEETVSTLKFADRARAISNNPTVNTSRDMGSVLALKEKEIQRLRQLLAQYMAQGGQQGGGQPHMALPGASRSGQLPSVSELQAVGSEELAASVGNSSSVLPPGEPRA